MSENWTAAMGFGSGGGGGGGVPEKLMGGRGG